MKHDELRGMGRHEEVFFRYSSGPVRPVYSGRDLLRRLGRVFVIGVLASSGVFYGAKLLMANQVEVLGWVRQHVGMHVAVAPSVAHLPSANQS